MTDLTTLLRLLTSALAMSLGLAPAWAQSAPAPAPGPAQVTVLGFSSRVLINSATECAGTGIEPAACMRALKSSTKTAIAFGV
ncbi:hypothetical protein RFM98_01110 [Mesorhizobium sp. VK9D]|uniref:hypothetical protein n=1 Tax=Mesorhizobium australafricanum TaxID=3072311 RepID=UPI002A23B85B|nr:hypothetical protein [Mesorhizobium sp. VK9D]MDX8451348.1 hypothetical protein [Mesorhizobium sp. VK9D]